MLEVFISLLSLGISIVFVWMWYNLWTEYDLLRIEYGRLWCELKTLEQKGKANEDYL